MSSGAAKLPLSPPPLLPLPMLVPATDPKLEVSRSVATGMQKGWNFLSWKWILSNMVIFKSFSILLRIIFNINIDVILYGMSNSCRYPKPLTVDGLRMLGNSNFFWPCKWCGFDAQVFVLNNTNPCWVFLVATAMIFKMGYKHCFRILNCLKDLLWPCGFCNKMYHTRDCSFHTVAGFLASEEKGERTC